MHVFNVRLGFATNSSSTHSLIFLPDAVQDDMGMRDRFIGFGDGDDEPEYAEEPVPSSEFGWQFFTAASDQAKRIYLSQVLASALNKSLPPSISEIVIRDWLNVDYDHEGYIDHQSIISLPMEMVREDYQSRPFVSKQFFDELKDFFLDPNLKILGGNDNTEEQHPLTTRPGAIPVNLPIPLEDSGWICRKDELYNYWALFKPQTGTKLRFRLTRNGDMRNVPRRAFAPELVDVKITNYCPFDCEFCYQDSVPEGTHADNTDLYGVISTLGELGVFEVALGGGEPTMLPNFGGVLKNCRDHGIVPNFTTRNLGWLRQPDKVNEYMEHAGAFAYSAQNAQEVEKLNALLVAAGIKGDRWPYGYETRYNKAKVCVHVVMGTMDQYRFQQILTACHQHKFGVTLLGYKDVGRGGNVQPIDYGWWLTRVRELQGDRRCPPIGIDTIMVQQYQEALEAAGTPEVLYTAEEGKWSCYIDAVENKVGPSSFCDPEQMVDFSRQTFLETFQGF